MAGKGTFRRGYAGVESVKCISRTNLDGAARRLTELAPRLDHASTQFWIGRALEETGDLEGARRRYALAQRRDPAWPAPLGALIRKFSDTKPAWSCSPRMAF